MSRAPTIGGLARAETIKLSMRTSVRLSIAVLVLLAVGSALLLFGLKSMVAAPTLTTTTAGGVSTTAPVVTAQGPGSVNLASALDMVRFFHDLFLFRTMLIAVIAVSFAGEFVGRTLREDVVRPVSRTQVLLAKWLAIQAFVAAGTIVPVVLASLLGVVLLGHGGDLAVSYQDWGLTWLGDAGFATMAMAISIAVRSVAGTIGGTVLYWVFDKMLRLVLLALESARDQGLLDKAFTAYGMKALTPIANGLISLRPFLPSSAFDIAPYMGPFDGGWQAFAALAIYTSASAWVAWWVFSRLDID